LQLRLDEVNVSIAAERDLVGSLRKELLECQLNLSHHEGCRQATKEITERRAHEAEQRFQELESKTSSLRGELAEKQQVISELTQRLAIAETPSDQHERELLMAKARIHELEQSEKELLQRATNITVRYEASDLVRGVIIVRWLFTSMTIERQREDVGSKPRPEGARSLWARACGEG